MSKNERIICQEIKETLLDDISIDEIYSYHKDTVGFKKELIILDIMDFKTEVTKELQALILPIVISIPIVLLITIAIYYFTKK